ncbi:hypothetical protein SDC9_113648 [bioreactor metagenome]|uniref:Uncharacterized protein n=1 Tax=bioreactor metagenome TaxID=1076179 RepID=A0A645BNC1_9ZZZZ
MLDTIIWNGSRSSDSGAGIFSIIRSNKTRRFSSCLSGTREAVPSRPDAYTTGTFSCSSVAPRSIKRSYTSSRTCAGRAAGRSILLTTIIGTRWRARAFFNTVRVCGMQPSKASTSRRTPSTIERLRSTSPPKSACPGVSTILIL